MTNVTWVESYEGKPATLTPVVVYLYRNRVSINTHYGCSLGCTYCISAADNFAKDYPAKPSRIAEVKGTLSALASIKSSIEGYRLSLGDFSDPFHDKIVQKDTMELVAGLAAMGCQEPVAITSKIAPPAYILDEIARYPLNLTIYISLGDVSGRAERVPVEERLILARRSHEAGLHTVLLMRPLHPAWSVPADFGQYLPQFAGNVSEVVMAGLRTPEPVMENIFHHGVAIAKQECDPAVPIFDPEFEAKMLAVVSESLPGVPVSRTRACPSNRRYNLPCLAPSTKKYPLPKHLDLWQEDNGFSKVRRDWNGYCQLHPMQRTVENFTSQQIKAFETLSLVLDASPAISWRLIGGSARVLCGTSRKCTDIDFVVEPSQFREAVGRLSDSDRGLRVSKCGGICSRCSTCLNRMNPTCQIQMKSKEMAVGDIAGVQIDFSPLGLEDGFTVERTYIAGLSLPVEIRQSL